MLLTAADIAAGRQIAESEMVDRCIIKRFDPSDRVWNESTMQYDDGPGTIVYEGKCRVQVRADINQNAYEAVVGDHEWTIRNATVQLPIAGTSDIVADCVFELTKSPYDPDRVGMIANLRAETKPKTQATHRRFYFQEVVS